MKPTILLILTSSLFVSASDYPYVSIVEIIAHPSRHVGKTIQTKGVLIGADEAWFDNLPSIHFCHEDAFAREQGLTVVPESPGTWRSLRSLDPGHVVLVGTLAYKTPMHFASIEGVAIGNLLRIETFAGEVLWTESGHGKEREQ